MAPPSGVTVSMSVVLREWGWMNGRSVALRFVSKTASQEQQIAALHSGMPGLIDRVTDKADVTGPLPLLDAAVVLVYNCAEKPVLLAIIDELVEMMRGAGLDGKFTAGGGYSPLQDSHAPGFGAGLVLASTHGGSDEMGVPTWHPDLEALDAIVGYAADWCAVEGARYWIGAGVGVLQNEVTREQIPPLLTASLRQLPWTTIAAVDGRRVARATIDYRAESWDIRLARMVQFDPDGYVSFTIGGAELDWEECTATLRDVLRDLAPQVVCGVIVPQSHISRAGWRDLTARVKDPDRVTFHHDGLIGTAWRDPSVALTTVPTAFGTQLLGPGHPDVTLDDQWDTEPLPAGRRLVSHRNPDAWFAREPDSELLAAARLSFGELIENADHQPSHPQWHR